ncbi:hypothetical protein O181_123280 [Austropuccinia psidii MF-1]|uniref:Uncharacterized protein n=1 Tax=Austropuccinia psidii MF-1 TaxID=1389203 RepID=A0A9Q3Q422_9BASI|nr:hypothetical protein [Austropuccinia psidii MF-1]
MSFNFTPLPSSLKFKKNSPPLSHSSNHFDDVMVRTKPDSAHCQNDLKDDEAIIPPLDVMFRTKPNIEHHEDNNTKSNHKQSSPKAKDNTSMIQNKVCITLAIQTKNIKNFQPF